MLKKMRKMSKDNKGFTLVEVIVVLVILAVLVAIAVPSMTGFIGEADDKAYVAEARTAYVAAQAFVTEKSADKSITDKTTIGALLTNKAEADWPTRVANYMKGSATAGASFGTVTVDTNGKITKLQYKVNGQTITITPGSGTEVE